MREQDKSLYKIINRLEKRYRYPHNRQTVGHSIKLKVANPKPRIFFPLNTKLICKTLPQEAVDVKIFKIIQLNKNNIQEYDTQWKQVLTGENNPHPSGLKQLDRQNKKYTAKKKKKKIGLGQAKTQCFLIVDEHQKT